MTEVPRESKTWAFTQTVVKVRRDVRAQGSFPSGGGGQLHKVQLHFNLCSGGWKKKKGATAEQKRHT